MAMENSIIHNHNELLKLILKKLRILKILCFHFLEKNLNWNFSKNVWLKLNKVLDICVSTLLDKKPIQFNGAKIINYNNEKEKN